jgi:pimeloyl-ACP methyl ester carboxylesterase
VKLLLLHAFPLDERMWAPQLPVLDGHDVIAPRLYGRGPTMDAWAESIAAETDGELVVVGASMGGYGALALTRRVPGRVRALLLVGSRPDADSDERRAARAGTFELIRQEGADGLWQWMVPRLFADESKADERLLYRDADGLAEALGAIRDRPDSTDLARSFAGPLQFFVGEHDPFVSAQDLAGFDVQMFPGAGHLLNLERTDEFNDALLEFVARV